MAKLSHVLLLVLCLLLTRPDQAWAQTATFTNTAFSLLVAPASNSVLIAETTNTILVTLRNPESFTNVLISGLVATNQVHTNMLGTNITANTNIVGDDLRLRFRVRPPIGDESTNETRFVTELVTGPTTNGYLLTLRVQVRGEDLTLTNAPTDDPSIFQVGSNLTLIYRVLPRPQNNHFTNAFKIDSAGGVGVGSNNFANLEIREPSHAQVPSSSASVWWTWSAGANTNVLVDTAGSSFKPVLAVYTGNSVSTLQPVASSTNDILNRLQANLNFNATRGVTYRIAVSGFDSNSVGNIRLRVVPGGTPDTRAPSILISTPNREALVGTDILTISGTARDGASTDSGISNVVLQVNNGPRTNATGTTSWAGNVVLPAGTNLVRAIAFDYAGNESIADAVVVRYVSPTNDFFGSARPLTGVGGILTWTNNAATREAGEPLHAGNEGGRSVWFSFRAPTTGTLSLTTQGSTFDTLLALYTGESLTNLQEIASNDDLFSGSQFSAIDQNVTSNQLYYVCLDAYGASVGTYSLQYAFVSPTPGQFYSVSVSSLPGGQVSPPTSIYPAGARLTLTATPDLNYEFVGWEGNSTGANPLTLTVNQNLTLTARFRPSLTNVTDDFETGSLNRLAWSSSPRNPWIVQTNQVFTGRFAAQSSPIPDSAQTVLSLTTNMIAGTAAFDFLVSSEDGWDHLEFLLNGERLGRWSGQRSWTNFTFKVPAGTNRMEWIYSKDSNFSEGEDLAAIDNVYLPVAPVQVSELAARIVATRLPNRAAQVTVIGYPGRRYEIEGSVDLVVWIPLATRSSDSGVIQFIDNQAATHSARFYRAVTR